MGGDEEQSVASCIIPISMTSLTSLLVASLFAAAAFREGILEVVKCEGSHHCHADPDTREEVADGILNFLA